MLIDGAEDLATLGLLVACAYAFLNAYARHQRPQWTASLTRRRLAVLTLLTLLTLAVGAIKARQAVPAMALAMLWTGAVAISRMVLGVHWPSDVLAAICLGIFIPLLASVVFDLRQRRRSRPA